MTTCVRCLTPTPSTTTERVGVGGDTYALDLCDRHADMLQTDLLAWTRLGVIQETDVPRRPGRATPAGVVLVSHIAVPTSKAPDETPAVLDMPARSHAWSLTLHAVERCGQRRVTPEQALAVADAPERIEPGNQPHTQVRWRGPIGVVVELGTFNVLTVLNTALQEAVA